MNRPPFRMSSPRRGFTLIEVMIAIAILATLSLMAWRGLDSMSRAQARLAERADQTTRLMRALQQFERDVDWRTTVELPSPGSPWGLTPVWLTTSVSALPTGQTPQVFELIRSAPAEPGKWQRVQWWLQAGTLYRASGAPSATQPLPAPLPGERTPVLEDVTAFDVQAWTTAGGWQPVAAGAARRPPTTGLQVLVSVRRGTGPVLSYRQVSALN